MHSTRLSETTHQRQGQGVVAVSDSGNFSRGVDIAHRSANPSASFGSIAHSRARRLAVSSPCGRVEDRPH